MSPSVEEYRQPYAEPDASPISWAEAEDTGSGHLPPALDPREVQIDTQLLSVHRVMQRISAPGTSLDALYPGSKAWTTLQQARFIESVLIQMPLYAYYVDSHDYSTWTVMDGRNRLRTLQAFILDEHFTLQHLEYYPQLEGHTFSSLPSQFQRRLMETELTVHALRPGVPDDVRYSLFSRIRPESSPETPQLIRNALHPRAGAWIAVLAQQHALLDALRHTPASQLQRMELVNRFLAFYLLGPEAYRPDLDRFLNQSLGEAELLQLPDMDRIAQAFEQSMRLLPELLGRMAFTRTSGMGSSPVPFSKAVFEVWSVACARLSLEQHARLAGAREAVLSGWRILLGTPRFAAAVGSSADPELVRYRHAEVQRLIQAFI